jgi:hypothetical protein
LSKQYGDYDELGEYYRVQKPVESFIRISQVQRSQARGAICVAF